MRKLSKIIALPVAVLAMACAKGRSSDTAAVNGDLQKDLELASAAGLDLAASGGSRTQIVSAIEQGPRSAPAPARTKKKTGTRRAPRPGGTVAPVQTPAVGDQPEQTVVAEAPAPAPQAVSDPAPAATRPEPVAVGIPSGGSGSGGMSGEGTAGAGGGWGGVLGGVVGVVIRGGGVGDDHCDPRHDRRGRRGAVIGGTDVMINQRYPAPGGRSPSTFPRY